MRLSRGRCGAHCGLMAAAKVSKSPIKGGMEHIRKAVLLLLGVAAGVRIAWALLAPAVPVLVSLLGGADSARAGAVRAAVKVKGGRATMFNILGPLVATCCGWAITTS